MLSNGAKLTERRKLAPPESRTPLQSAGGGREEAAFSCTFVCPGSCKLGPLKGKFEEKNTKNPRLKTFQSKEFYFFSLEHLIFRGFSPSLCLSLSLSLSMQPNCIGHSPFGCTFVRQQQAGAGVGQRKMQESQRGVQLNISPPKQPSCTFLYRGSGQWKMKESAGKGEGGRKGLNGGSGRKTFFGKYQLK